jgi:hypothetical protein
MTLRLETVPILSPKVHALMQRSPDIGVRLQRVVAVSTIRVESGAKAKSPVLTGRMKGSITHRFEEGGLVAFIGTNIRAKPTKSYPEGYHYPKRQEFDESLSHITGEWGFLRKSLRDESEVFREQCKLAVVRGIWGES